MAPDTLAVGEKAPLFSLLNQDDKRVNLSDFDGQWLVLYFYPRDNTPGCTTEACDFTAGLPNFRKLNCTVLGVSPDSVRSHQSFVVKQNLKIDLLTDLDHAVMETYGVWKRKSMYGRDYLGVVRTTFLIDPKGKIARIWEDVKVKGHVDEVVRTLNELAG